MLGSDGSNKELWQFAAITFATFAIIAMLHHVLSRYAVTWR